MRIEQVLDVIYEAIDELNTNSDTGLTGIQLDKNESQPLYGDDPVLDSMGFVNFIMILEPLINERFDVEISLIDDTIASEDDNPFETLGSLSRQIMTKLGS